MRKARVSGEPSLVKDLVSGAVLADDVGALELRKILRGRKSERSTLALEAALKDLERRVLLLENREEENARQR